mmetsp:Transcript_1446/g.3006  ORF Transcript_1446/g.3006 Transcript_1446/m.3006 type:complete len:207 (-) Transcript_1446:960-1580(-)
MHEPICRTDSRGATAASLSLPLCDYIRESTHAFMRAGREAGSKHETHQNGSRGSMFICIQCHATRTLLFGHTVSSGHCATSTCLFETQNAPQTKERTKEDSREKSGKLRNQSEELSSHSTNRKKKIGKKRKPQLMLSPKKGLLFPSHRKRNQPKKGRRLFSVSFAKSKQTNTHQGNVRSIDEKPSREAGTTVAMQREKKDSFTNAI